MSFISESDLAVQPSTGERSSLHPVSNTPILHFKDLVSDANIFEGRLPQSGLLRFLHEFTHHWTFDSVLGEVVFLVTEQADRAYWSKLLREPDAKEADQLMHAIRVVRCHTALKFLA